MAKQQQTERFGGPGSSHQDRSQPGKNQQAPGQRAGGEAGAKPRPDEPTNPRESRVSGGGGERDRHHTHTGERS
jgi:hypothetical protein